ncbi:hypothetical protein N7448_008081 [Penicillium atrosanguineum]|uniref:Uncharacterized protein n=1 Tax=Penicillium atrosanguineum TaxID=1132637 RepID=A0A9W9QCL1_9EURO|nr:uncharacterized protein N7443_000902 [Penicillium atrosanguineum]KAJ5127302.1 hypothetical protein N7448_008081 [Penicillium atrosanguineum]KAJ5147505.1 hypothetical protein N7526_000857 [Penicillium atrosanguineum]KAJ5314018.1 hypothetical protein N7443_000902 [Penicillium atrosanguineum]KAJ5331186.1 hypothetical protein N7476_000969 [Penicillium atrosanguineum]
MATTITNGRANALRSRNIALVSMVAVVTSGWLLFRAQSPNGKDVLYSEKEKQMMQGRSGSGAIARAPSRERVEKS